MNMQETAFTLAGKQFSFEQVANEFAELQDSFDMYKDEREGLGVHFLLMIKDKDLSGFLGITSGIEQAKNWKSKQHKEGTIQAPQAWKQYKSNAKAYLELGGKLDSSIPTVSELNKALQTKRKENKEQGQGEEASETVTKAIEVAAGNSQTFANAVAKLVALYGHLTPDLQAELEDNISHLVNEYKEEATMLEEIGELLNTATKQAA